MLHITTPQPLLITPALQGHVCGPSCSCKHRFLWISLIFYHQFCLNYMGTVCHWQPCWSTKSVRFIGQRWYFNPQWTPVEAINKASSVKTYQSAGTKCAITMLTYKSGFVEGFRKWRRYILAAQRKPGPQGSCSIASHCILSDRSEQNSSKFRHTICNVFVSCSAI